MKKFALVIGASGAIGSVISKRLANDGWSLYLHYYRGEEKIRSLAHQLIENYPNQEFFVVQSNFSDDNGADELAKQLFSIQAVVFAGGHAYYGLLEDTPIEEINKLWKVHVQNPMRLLALLSSKLRSNKQSYVIFISSIWGETGAAYESVYSAVKGAQNAFVKAYAKEVALQHILVNAISPGYIDTTMNSHLTEEERNELISTIPLEKAGVPEDIANMVSFLLSGQAKYITGQIFRVNGGWYI